MASDALRPGERLDDLLIGGLKIIQHEARFRFSLDAVLLAHFAALRRGAAVVDLGAGSGVLGLLLAARGAGTVCGVELDEPMADMARRSISLNGLDGQLTILTGDVRELAKGGLLAPQSRDLVVANPPYRTPGGGGVSPREGHARHEIAGGLADFVAAAAYLLKERGRFAMVHLPERLVDIAGAMRAAGLEPKRLRLVHSAAGKPAKLLLVEGVRSGRPGLRVLPPLLVYDEDGGYSSEIRAYYRAGE